jgi:hypothetical protein
LTNLRAQLRHSDGGEQFWHITGVVCVHDVNADNFDFISRHVGLGINWDFLYRLDYVKPFVPAHHTRQRSAAAMTALMCNRSAVTHALPKMVCLLSSQGVGTVVMKNCSTSQLVGGGATGCARVT